MQSPPLGWARPLAGERAAAIVVHGLYGPIEMLNPRTAEVTEAFRSAAGELAEILESRDQERFTAMFEEVRGFFGEFADLERNGFAHPAFYRGHRPPRLERPHPQSRFADERFARFRVVDGARQNPSPLLVGEQNGETRIDHAHQ